MYTKVYLCIYTVYFKRMLCISWFLFNNVLNYFSSLFISLYICVFVDVCVVACLYDSKKEKGQLSWTPPLQWSCPEQQSAAFYLFLASDALEGSWSPEEVIANQRDGFKTAFPRDALQPLVLPNDACMR